MKVAAEAWLRRELRQGLAADTLETLAFDAHTGQPLTFDVTTRELRQPLYALDAAGRVTEIPLESGWRLFARGNHEEHEETKNTKRSGEYEGVTVSKHWPSSSCLQCSSCSSW